MEDKIRSCETRLTYNANNINSYDDKIAELANKVSDIITNIDSDVILMNG